MENQGLLFIPDISGFTRFVNETDINHSRLIIEELLEILINANQIGLEVSEVEGDAILFYRFGDSPPLAEVYKQVEKMFLEFHRHLAAYEYRRYCYLNRPVRPFLRRFSRSGAQPGRERCRKAQNLQNPLWERAPSRHRAIGLWGPLDQGARAVLKRFEHTLGCGAVGGALRIASLPTGPLHAVGRPRTATDTCQPRQHPHGHR
jgi:hypothetical protein